MLLRATVRKARPISVLDGMAFRFRGCE